MKKVLFIGISDKPGCSPLQSGTKSGDLIDRIIMGLDVECYKSNLVNFPPVDEKGKLRYPTKSEMDLGYKNLQRCIVEINPDVCIFLGDKVTKYLSDKINGISIKHPSYIAVYKRKYESEYIDEAISLIKLNLNKNN